MTDLFSSLTAADIDHTATLLGLYHQPYQDYPADVKAELVHRIRREVRAMQAGAPDLAPAATLMTTLVHPALVEFVEKADRDCPEDVEHGSAPFAPNVQPRIIPPVLSRPLHFPPGLQGLVRQPGQLAV
jgi:hypothetical protein